MKRFILPLLTLITICIGCQKLDDQFIIDSSKKFDILINVSSSSSSSDTRMSVVPDKNNISWAVAWEANDSIDYIENGATVASKFTAVSVNENNSNLATFSGATTANKTAHFIYPRGKTKFLNNSWCIDLSKQKVDMSDPYMDYGENNLVMISKEFTTNNVGEVAQNSIEMLHILATFELKITNSSTSSYKVTGATISGKDISNTYIIGENSKSGVGPIKLDINNNTELESNANQTIPFSLVPFTFNNDINIKVEFNNGTAYAEIIKKANNTTQFNAGTHNTILIDINDNNIESRATIERNVLIAFYNATDGDNWRSYRKENWCSDKDISEWDGITTNEQGYVTEISRSLCGLSGEIPAEIGNLLDLEVIGFSTNYLSGEIPIEIFNLDKLTSISITSNRLTGELPAEIGNSKNLTYLNLRGNTLSGNIPKELSNLPKLSEINLEDNNFSGEIPIELGNLLELGTLDIRNNCLTGDVPESLMLHENYSSYKFLFNPQQEGYGLNIDYGNMEFSQSERDALMAIYNATGGENWSSFYNTNWGSDKVIAEWKGVGVNSEGKVISLNLYDSNLTGEIPAEIGNLTNLINLSIMGPNKVSGSIPKELGNLSKLENLSLYDDNLTGEIPVEIGNLTNLINLSISGNKISGSIPKELGSLSKLEKLNLFENNLAGEIPVELGNLANLEYLSLKENRFTCSVPESLINHPNYSNFFFNPQQDGYGVIEPSN